MNSQVRDAVVTKKAVLKWRKFVLDGHVICKQSHLKIISKLLGAYP